MRFLLGAAEAGSSLVLYSFCLLVPVPFTGARFIAVFAISIGCEFLGSPVSAWLPGT